MGVSMEKRLHWVRVALWKRPGPIRDTRTSGSCTGGKALESPPLPSRTRAAASQRLEGRGRAGLILNRRPALVCLRRGAD